MDRYISEDTINEIAKVCHDANRSLCQIIGDHSQPAWEDAPEWQQSSARAGVRLHLSGDHGPEASHQSWMAQKIAEGWRLGSVKDPEKKTHHCLVDFEFLPKNQKAKDYLFRAIVHGFKDFIKKEYP